MNSDFEPLCRMIDALTAGSNCRVCIQNVTGEYNSIISELPYDYRFHVGPVCRISKASPAGMRLCANCKFNAIDHARQKGGIYTGCCEYGLYEVVCPVYFGDRISFMIFVGNLLYDEAKFSRRAARSAQRIGVSAEEIFSCRDMLCPVENGDFGPYLRIAELLRSYIIQLYSQLPENVRHTDRSCRIVDNVINYTNENYIEPLNIRNLSRIFYVSENYLGRLFKREMGITYAEYLNSVRIRLACAFLKDTRDSVLQISERCGYENVTYFNRVFRKITGMTPIEYRRKSG